MLPLPRILVAVLNRPPCVVTLFPLPPMLVAKFPIEPPAVAWLLSPKRLVAKLKIEPGLVSAVESPPMTQAKLRTDPALVVALEVALPSTKARLNGPAAWAVAPSPIAKEALNNVLVHAAPPPMPKIDAQVAFAVGADPNPALTNNPLATAPATRAPVILRCEFTMLTAIICCSNHD